MGETVFLTVQSDYHKVQVPVDDIQYITTEGRKTKITRADGSALSTNRSLKDVYAELPGELFSNINRGIVVSRKYVRQDRDGVVTMLDGTEFRRRVRSERGVRRTGGADTGGGRLCPADTLAQWMGTLPMPMCIMEMVYRSRGRGVEFLLRYCNKAMEQLEQVQLADIQDKGLELLSGVGNAKWLTVFADVAINGSSRQLEDLWGDGKFYRLLCYQPQPGFCALMLVDLTKETSLVQELFQRGR